MAATSFNPVDVTIRAGYLQQFLPVRFPHTPGLDVARTVAELGDGVDAPPIDAPVIGFLLMNEDCAAAEYVLAPAAVLTRAPQCIPLTTAAGLPAGALTARQALFEYVSLQSGQRALVNGAAVASADHGPVRQAGRRQGDRDR